MPRILNASQLAHVTYYDTLWRHIGAKSFGNGTTLFATNQNGLRSLTNMKTPGALPGDQILLIKALRIACFFQSLNDPEFTSVHGSTAALVANVVSTGARAVDCYNMFLWGSYFTLEVGQKPYLLAPTWFAPAGGGLSGYTTESSRTIATSGVPASSSTLRFAKPIQVSARQPFNVKFDFYNFPRGTPGTGASGGALGADLDPIAFLNGFDGISVGQVHAEGIETRDVE